MTLSQIAAVKAAQTKTNPKAMEALLEAEARLLKATIPEISRMNTNTLMTKRYVSDISVSQVAALNPIVLATTIINNPTASPIQTAAANDYLLLAGNYPDITNTDDFGLPDIAVKYYNSPEVLAKAAAKTEALRKARPDVREQFNRLARGEISNDEYSDYIRSIQHQLDAHDATYYDEDWISSLQEEAEPGIVRTADDFTAEEKEAFGWDL